ncbi:Pirin-like protein [Forsythia ovata]|uniref:Pirin-like protein n=1 Tax=Forsythia ovata TaxID=205694 RepID=A0ABD1T3N1_9LAMI
MLDEVRGAQLNQSNGPTRGGSRVEQPRSVTKKILAKPQSEGVGAVVRRSIGRPEVKYFDPFLMLDEFAVSPPAGFPDHPHRGFETVTYMLQGAFTHQDFAGHKGTIRTGDVQWMTAGRGIIHSEMPAGEGTQRGQRNGVEVKVIAGEAMGIHSPVYTRTPTLYLDFTLKPHTQYHQSIPESWNAFVYIIEGEGVFGSHNSPAMTAHHLLILGPGDGLSVLNKSSKQLRFVLVGGQPLNEPVVQHGPFVMNTQDEIDKTVEDYYYCKNGFEMARFGDLNECAKAPTASEKNSNLPTTKSSRKNKNKSHNLYPSLSVFIFIQTKQLWKKIRKISYSWEQKSF